MRIDQRDFAGERTVRIGARTHGDLLANRNERQITLGNIDDHPDEVVGRDPEQNVARRRPHAVDGVAFHDLTVLRCRPAYISRDFARALNVGNKFLRGIQIFKASARAF